jgi:hypothetical protein
MMAVVLADVRGGERLSERELEAFAVRCWGDQLPYMHVLWEANRFTAMATAILIEQLPRGTLARLMRPTRGGKTIRPANVRQYMKRAANKLGVLVEDLPAVAAKGLIRTEARAAMAELKRKDPARYARLRRRALAS